MAIVVGMVLAAASCGGSDDPAAPVTSTTVRSTGSALTDDDTARLAQMLFRNYRDGGATVAASFDYAPSLSVRMAGDVDWVDHTGRLTVTSTFADGRPQDTQEVVFAEDAVYEAPDEATADRLAAEGRTDVRWIRRPPALDGRPLDQVINLIISLAATRPDNPQLLAQSGTTYDRQEEVEGRAADVFTSEQGTSYWLRVADDRLVRLQGTVDGFAGPVVIDVIDPGPRPIEVPTGPGVVDAADLAG